MHVIFPPGPPLELGEVEHAREYYHTTGDVEGTLFRMPKARYIERQLLVGVQKHAMLHNYLGAFNFVRSPCPLPSVLGHTSSPSLAL